MEKSKDICNYERQQKTKPEIDVWKENSNASIGCYYQDRESIFLSLSSLSDEDTLPPEMKGDILSIYDGLNKLFTDFLELRKEHEKPLEFPKNNYKQMQYPSHNAGEYFTYDKYAGYYKVRPWKEIGSTLYIPKTTKPGYSGDYSVRNCLEKQLIAHNYKIIGSLTYSLGFFTPMGHFSPRLGKEAIQEFKETVLGYFNRVRSYFEAGGINKGSLEDFIGEMGSIENEEK